MNKAACRVSVIIKALNEEAHIAAAIESALAALEGIGGEVVLADSCSTDRTVAIASAYPVCVVQLLDPRERCCGIGAQLGYQHTCGEYIYLMDGDMCLQPGFLEQGLAFLALHPEVAGVGGRVLERNLGSLEYRERKQRMGQPQTHLQPGGVDRLDGGALYRRLAIQETGYLSDRNLHSYEEFDLAVRLRARGWKLWRLPCDAVSHHGHTAPALRLLWRRWVTGYAWGIGELLRASIGRPWLRLVLRDLRELRLYAGVLAGGPALALLAWLSQPVAVRAGLAAALVLLPVGVMTLRKRSLARALYSVTSWTVHAAGLARGLLRRRRSPTAPIASQVLRGSGLSAEPSPPAGPRRFIYIACPWSPVGGGMFKVADYLIQSQAASGPSGGDPSFAQLRPLDTRGSGSAARSLGVLAGALVKLVQGRRQGALAGVHVNMAERLSLMRKSVVVIASRALGLPVVLHLHAAQLHRAWPRLPAPARALVRWVFSLPQCCIVLGHESAAFVARELRVPAERIEIVINGVPQPRLARRPRAAPGAGALLRALFVGNLSDRKGVPQLLHAMALAPLASLRVELTLAGGGDVAGYQAMALRLGVAARVRFEGWADQARIAQLLSQADVFVLPSHDEGLPLAILEALAHGVAVVCTPVGEITHVLQDGREARFVPAGDPAALSEGLAEVLQDTALREALEVNGRALYAKRFSLPRFFAHIAALHARHFGIAGALPADAGSHRSERKVAS